MKFRIFSLIFGLMLALSVSVLAQEQTVAITLDTITNTEVDTIYFPHVMDARGDLYDLNYQVIARQISGTTNITVKHAVSNAKAGNYFTVTTDSIDLDGTSSAIMNLPSQRAARSALVFTGTGTQSSEIRILARLIRRE